MATQGAWCLALWLGVAPAAVEPRPAVEETWEVAQVEGAKVGFLHTTVRALDDGGGKRLRTTAALDLNFRRNQALLRLRMEQGSEETPEGKVVGVFMRQFHGEGRQLVPVRRQVELEGLGAVVLTRTTRARATAPASDPAPLADIGLKTLIPLNRVIPRPHATRAALYRVTLRDEPDPGTALVSDGHQE